MSYEKVRVVKIEQGKPDPSTGEVRNYIVMERLVPIRVGVRDDELRKHYDTLRGKLAMVPVVQDEYQGRKFWKFEGDGMPLTGTV